MISIRPFTVADQDVLQAHLRRHFAESGHDDIIFIPFDLALGDGPSGITPENSFLPLDRPGWQRWFCAWNDATGEIVGHVDLKGDKLRAASHRCELGIGIERAWRGQGLGQRLMETAIGFAQAAESLVWLDLRVFAHNTRARALYTKMGFVEVGVRHDLIRIGDQRIDDVVMVLRVG